MRTLALAIQLAECDRTRLHVVSAGARESPCGWCGAGSGCEGGSGEQWGSKSSEHGWYLYGDQEIGSSWRIRLVWWMGGFIKKAKIFGSDGPSARRCAKLGPTAQRHGGGSHWQKHKKACHTMSHTQSNSSLYTLSAPPFLSNFTLQHPILDACDSSRMGYVVTGQSIAVWLG